MPRPARIARGGTLPGGETDRSVRTTFGRTGREVSVGGSARDTYLEGVDRRRAPLVRELDRLVMGACPDLVAAVKYRILMYALKGDYRSWVCAIDAHPRKAVGLRFLYGALLDDKRGLLRPGTSSLSTLDVAVLEEIDDGLVTGFVREAVVRHEELKSRWAARKATEIR